MKRLNLLILIILIASITSCGDDTDPVTPEPELTPEEIIIQNCHIIKVAADAFMEENGGEYAWGVTDTSLANNTLQDLLPNGELLLNPYTGLKTEPRLLDFTGQIGEIRYSPEVMGGVCVGYIVATFNGQGQWLYALFSHSEEYFIEEMSVVARCFGMQRRAQRFADNNDGIFPLDVDTDTDLSGHTLKWHIRDTYYGENAFTEEYTNPVNGTASIPGEIGYRPVTANNIPVGYIITGFGAYELIKEISDIPTIDY